MVGTCGYLQRENCNLTIGHRMSSSAQKLLNDLTGMFYDPVKVQRAMYQTMDETTDGRFDVMTATNPAIQLIEMFAVAAAALERRDFVHLRAQYPQLAQEYSDLYRHMSDQLYLDRFAKPIRIPFIQWFSKNEILTSAVPVGDTGTKKLIIPRGTEFSVDGLAFTMEYPLEIRVMKHGALQCVLDTSVSSPLELVETNIVDWYYNKFPGSDEEFLFVSFPVTQTKRNVFIETVNPSQSFNKNFQLTAAIAGGKADQFYYCRVFGFLPDGTRTEYVTTHSDQVYAPDRVTAILTVTERNLNVAIPLFYITAGMVSARIEIVIYTTKGSLTVSMPNYVGNAFTRIVGDDYNDPSDSEYVAKYSNLRTYGLGSDAVYTGGSDALSFAELKNRVILNANTSNIPITDVQMNATLKVRGYDVIKSIDDIMLRVYLATRNLPPPNRLASSGALTESSLFTTGAGCAIETIQTTMEALSELAVVVNNHNRITITPQALFKYTDGVCNIVSDQERTELSNYPIDKLIGTMNTGKYVYTPFYYVLDKTDSVFACRAYYLDNPTLRTRVFISENDTAGVSVSAGKILFTKTPTGYRLTIQTRSDDSYKELNTDNLFAQLCYTPPLESQRAYINGELIGYLDDELVWQFDIVTNYDLDRNDLLQLTNFSMFVNDVRPFASNLTQTFELLFGVSDYTYFGLQKTAIDNLVAVHMLDDQIDHTGLTHERLTLVLGESLDSLWSNGSTVAGSIQYKHWDHDYPLLYTETVFEIDPATNRPLFDLVNGEIVFRVLHNVGDPVINPINGEPEYRYRKGDVMTDVDGTPVEADGRKTTRQIDLLMLDGVYYFVTNPNDLEYKASIPKSIVSFLRNDIDTMRENLLEKTELYFYPKRTLGNNKVIVGNNLITTINAALSFEVNYHVDRITYGNSDLRATIEQNTSAVINRVLQRPTVSLSEITKQLDAVVGTEIISSSVEKMGVFQDIDTYSATDDSVRCGVKRILELQPDGTISVIEDIKVNWIRHREN